MNEVTFEVAAIVSEPLPIIQRFVSWYLRQNARRITLFFDQPDDPTIDALPADDRVVCIPCSEVFWRSLGLRPGARFTRRQRTVFNKAYRECQSDWFLNVDADELMYFPSADIETTLPTFGQAKAVRVLPMETVHVPSREGHHFRAGLGRSGFCEVYGADAPLAGRGAGIVGHSEGKSFVRAGQAGIQLKHHWAVTAEGQALDEKVLGRNQEAYLLHFLENGYPSWRSKLEWRLSSHGFSGPLKDRIEAVLADPNPEEGLRDLHKALFEIDEATAQQLEARNALRHFDVDFDPPP